MLMVFLFSFFSQATLALVEEGEKECQAHEPVYEILCDKSAGKCLIESEMDMKNAEKILANSVFQSQRYEAEAARIVGQSMSWEDMENYMVLGTRGCVLHKPRKLWQGVIDAPKELITPYGRELFRKYMNSSSVSAVGVMVKILLLEDAIKKEFLPTPNKDWVLKEMKIWRDDIKKEFLGFNKEWSVSIEKASLLRKAQVYAKALLRCLKGDFSMELRWDEEFEQKIKSQSDYAKIRSKELQVFMKTHQL